MQLHIELVGYLHRVWGAFGVLTGASLLILAVGTDAALLELGPVATTQEAAVWIFVVCGGLVAGLGAAMFLVGGALHRRRGSGRAAALALAVPNLVIVPFGTALAVYTLWVLQNDDARHEFGRPARNVPYVRSTWAEPR